MGNPPSTVPNACQADFRKGVENEPQRANPLIPLGLAMVGGDGIEPTTPAMSKQCSTAELTARHPSSDFRLSGIAPDLCLWPLARRAGLRHFPVTWKMLQRFEPAREPAQEASYSAVRGRVARLAPPVTPPACG